jgi:hypothetical protein
VAQHRKLGTQTAVIEVKANNVMQDFSFKVK